MKKSSEGNNNKIKKTMGRRKIEMKMIEKHSSRQVTFSKRRKGLFTKAAELCISTDAQVGILIQSIGGKTYSFGHPHMESVINHYRTGDSSAATWNTGNVAHLKQRYDMLCKSLEEEKRKKKNYEIKKLNDNNYWWNDDIENLGLEELKKYSAALEELQKNALFRADELMLLKNESMTVSFSDLIDPKQAAGAGGYFLDRAAADHPDNI